MRTRQRVRSRLAPFQLGSVRPAQRIVAVTRYCNALTVGVALDTLWLPWQRPGGAQTAGFGAFQKPLSFGGGPILFTTLGLLIVGSVWAFLYGMAGAISSAAQWVGQQCCTFLVVSSAFPSTIEEALLRGCGGIVGAPDSAEYVRV